MINNTVVMGKSSFVPLPSASRGWWKPGGMQKWRRPWTVF